MSTKLKLSVAQEKFIFKILDKHPDFVFECGWGDMEFHFLETIYNNGCYEDWQREFLNDIRENAKTAGIIL